MSATRVIFAGGSKGPNVRGDGNGGHVERGWYVRGDENSGPFATLTEAKRAAVRIAGRGRNAYTVEPKGKGYRTY